MRMNRKGDTIVGRMAKIKPARGVGWVLQFPAACCYGSTFDCSRGGLHRASGGRMLIANRSIDLLGHAGTALHTS